MVSCDSQLMNYMFYSGKYGQKATATLSSIVTLIYQTAMKSTTTTTTRSTMETWNSKHPNQCRSVIVHNGSKRNAQIGIRIRSRILSSTY